MDPRHDQTPISQLGLPGDLAYTTDEILPDGVAGRI